MASRRQALGLAVTGVVGVLVAGVAHPAAVRASSRPPAGAERIIVLGEEYVLADLLALGIEPVAATATVPEAGFHAVDQYDTSRIEALPVDVSVEYLATLEPDLIVAWQFWAEQAGPALDGLAPMVIVPDGLVSVDQIRFLGEQFDAADRAEALVEQLAAAGDDVATALGGLEVSVAAIYPGPSPAAFVDGPWVVPQSLIDAGVTLVPAADGLEPDEDGRVWLSTEQLSLLSAPNLVLMQSDLVEGESDALEQVMADPLWDLLPAVAADRVHVIDRLGYPGIEGHIRLLDELDDLFDSPS